jgi:DNA replication protein DnaC
MSKTETKSTVLLKHHLKALKLPTMLAEAEKIAQRCAADNADHLAFLLQLVELELIERERKAAERRLKAARFPATKMLDEFDFSARPSVNKPQVLELVKGEYPETAGRTSSSSGRPARGRRIWPPHSAWPPVPRGGRCGSSA